MGVAVADYDCDGWFDIFKTNFVDDTVNLYHNNGDGTFSDVSFLPASESTIAMLRGDVASSTTTMTAGRILFR